MTLTLVLPAKMCQSQESLASLANWTKQLPIHWETLSQNSKIFSVLLYSPHAHTWVCSSHTHVYITHTQRKDSSYKESSEACYDMLIFLSSFYYYFFPEEIPIKESWDLVEQMQGNSLRESQESEAGALSHNLVNGKEGGKKNPTVGGGGWLSD